MISPGPGRPEDAGITMEVIRAISARRCRFSASASAIRRSARCSAARSSARAVPMHGKTSTIEHDGRGVFTGIDGAVRRLALSLARRRGRGSAGRARSVGADARRRHDHGAAAPDAARSRRAVSSGVDPDRRRPPHPSQFPRGTAGLTMFPALIEKLTRHEDLTTDEAAAAMAEVMEGRAAPAHVAGLLIGLAMKGERPAEIVGLARDDARARGAGCRSATTTCSTPAAPAAIGPARSTSRRAPRSSSRRAACASPSTATARCRAGRAAPTCSRRSAFASPRRRRSSSAASRTSGIGFFFAPTFHPVDAARGAGAPRARRAHGVQPARPADESRPAPTRQLVGVPRPEFTELLARALMLLGSERAWVVHGADGIDELSTTGYTKISECRDGAVNTFYLHPADVGLPKASPGVAARAATRTTNARIIERILAGERGPAARRRAAERRARRCSSPARRRRSTKGSCRRRGRSIAATRSGRSSRLVVDLDRGAGGARVTRRRRSARDHRRRDAPDRRGPRRRGSRWRALGRARSGARRARPDAFAAALGRRDRVNVIAECKRRSPSRGVLRADYDPVGDRARSTRRPAPRRFRC